MNSASSFLHGYIITLYRDHCNRMMMYAELYGDIKKPGIKSPGGNITGYNDRCDYWYSN